jgi:mono/diheme cytochrome c family protein
MRKSGALFEYVRTLAGVSARAAMPLALTWLALSAPLVQAQEAAKPAASKPFDDLIANNCAKCHNATDWAGSLAFDTLDVGHVGEDPEVWEKAITKLRGRLMPPAGEKQPAQPEVDAFVTYLETSVDAAAKAQQVGHVPIQRLNRIEYAASVKQLVGVDVDPRQILPTEIEVEGFSNIAGALGMSPSFMEQYLSAARRVAQRAVGEPVPKMATVFYRGGGGGGGQAGPGFGQWTHHDGLPLGTRGGMSFTHVFPADGEYHFNFLEGDSIDAGLYPRGMETSATLVILVDGAEVARREIGGPDDLTLADRDGPKGRLALVSKVSGIPAQVKAGSHTVTATFIERSWAMSNDATAVGAGNGKMSGMPIIRDGLQVVGPFSPQGLSLSESRAKIFICQPKQASEERPCAEKITRHLATQAFRRPATDADVKLLMKFYETGRAEAGGFDSGVTELVTAVLSSPDFLYRAISTSPTPDQSRPLNDIELASRLSFFLWNQGPDEPLIALATSKRLADPAVLKAQVERMLKDPRARSLVEDFALSWLNLDELEQVEPQDRAFNSAMRTNFETEIRLFLASVLLENRSVRDLINADYTFVNESLAQQYDIPGVFGAQFRRVTLKNENRWGLLGKGAVLLRTSYGDRTSPVLRGAYVLDRIMGTPPTPPPPGVVTDLSIHEGQKPTTVRARLELHRTNPTCQGCHGLIDPPGLALENFDVTGRWRDIDALAKVPIETTAQLSSGVVLHGPADLRGYLNSRPDQFPTTVTRRLMMYALNREIEYFDMPQVRQIVRDAAASNYTFASIITGVVNSDSFRRQGPEVQSTKEAPPTKTASIERSGTAATTQLQGK